MRHDYNFPTWFWNDGVTDEERSRWMTQERVFRQAIRQDTTFARKARKEIERNSRKIEARSETVSLAENR